MHKHAPTQKATFALFGYQALKLYVCEHTSVEVVAGKQRGWGVDTGHGVLGVWSS